MSSYTIPNVIAQHPRGERIMDVYSHLLTERIVYLGTAIDPGVANTLIAQLIHLEAESPDLEINLYINCEGGDPSSMLALYDTMQYIQAPVVTTCVGQAIAVGAVLLAAGAPGRRLVLPHARIVLHQPAARGQGAVPDLILQADEVVRVRAEIESILSVHTGQSVQTLRHDTDRDRVFTAQAALEYGLVDQVLGQRAADVVTPGASAALRGEGEPGARFGDARSARGGDRLEAAQVACHLLGQVDERGAQSARQGGDHLAGRFLAPALDLGEVLRRYPGPAGRPGKRLPLIQPKGAQPSAEDLPPQWFLGSGFLGSGFLGSGFLGSGLLEPRLLGIAGFPRSAGIREETESGALNHISAVTRQSG